MSVVARSTILRVLQLHILLIPSSFIMRRKIQLTPPHPSMKTYTGIIADPEAQPLLGNGQRSSFVACIKAEGEPTWSQSMGFFLLGSWMVSYPSQSQHRRGWLTICLTCSVECAVAVHLSECSFTLSQLGCRTAICLLVHCHHASRYACKDHSASHSDLCFVLLTLFQPNFWVKLQVRPRRVQ